MDRAKKKKKSFYIPLLYVYPRTTSRAASGTIDRVTKQTKHLGRSRPQFEQVVGYELFVNQHVVIEEMKR